jgi:putative transposase
MTSTRDIHHRRSIRLQGYDYSQNGAYFITICTQNREYLFGHVIPVSTPDNPTMMVLNDAGHTVQAVWEEIPMHYTGIGIDKFVVMPNHVHGIVIIVGATPRGCPDTSAHGNRQIPDGPTTKNGQEGGQPQGVAPTGNMGPLSLGDIVHRFKTLTTKRYADGVKQSGWRSFPGKLWQRNYWEHVIRNEMELNRIREYIHNNPARWGEDRMNVDGGGPSYSPMVQEPVVTYPAEGWMT